MKVAQPLQEGQNHSLLSQMAI